MGAPAIEFFSGNPTEPGVPGPAREVVQWNQVTFYPNLKVIAGGPNDWVEWRIQRSADDVDWHDLIIIGQGFKMAAPGTDENPVSYVNRYTGAVGVGLKPSLALPLNSRFMRVVARRSPGAGATADLVIFGELSKLGQSLDIACGSLP